MARRRGFFAEMQHQARIAEQRQRQAAREHSAAVRRAEQAQRAAERARVAAARASEQDRKRLEREAALAHVEARQAEVEELNSTLQDRYQILDSLLTATLDVDDFVDLETLRVFAEHPSFPRLDLKVPVPAPKPIPDPPLPVKREPEAVKGLFGRKQKTAEAQEAVERQYAEDYWAWTAATEELPARRAAQDAAHNEAERRREEQLAVETAKYETECAAREAEAKEQNEALDQLIAGLGYGTADAVKEYVEIVLANSVYPEDFPVTHSSVFEPSTSELFVSVRIPGPETVPTIKQYRYVKANDEITPTAATQKDAKDRYATIVNNVALRTIHEVFEADRRGLIRSISLELGTETISPATGQPLYVPFVAVAANREQFSGLDLRAVVPAATLAHLGAAVSKNPQGLVPIASGGIRRGNE
ncbi:hypothetical protein [Microbacterium azadirachtae]|uniref:hypothetical protein n=1 Tax=Microbacterium azadirachtae TaxID=582680 RepID=UPI000698A6C2|nr:hypothetical protein [Microbacterium azadirachtae]